MQTNNDLNHIADYPIVALATPYVKSALSVIRISGVDCLQLLTKICTLRIQSKKAQGIYNIKPWTARRCIVRYPHTKECIDDAIIIVYKAPHSYTGEDMAELSIHGSLVGIEKILDALYLIGFCEAPPGEFTKRAFLNGKIDLTQAEAIHSIIDAHSSATHAEAIQQLSGSLTQKIEIIKQSITNIVAKYTVSLDYPDDEIQESVIVTPDDIKKVINMLTPLISSYDLGKLQKEGASVVLGGRTNVGKSSLFNVLLKEERAIVSEQEGTTRDFLESRVQYRGIPITLYDTAGLREGGSYVEEVGVKRSKTLLHNADIILFVFDAQKGWTYQDTETFALLYESLHNIIDTSHIILVKNKIDIIDSEAPRDSSNVPSYVQQKCFKTVCVSAKKYINIDGLQEALYKKITHGILFPKTDQVVISSLRQKRHLEACKNALLHAKNGIEQNVHADMISLDVDIALKELGAITGYISSEDILGVVFSSFCVGK